LFTESSHGDQLLAPPPLSGALTAPFPPLLHVSFQFLVYYSVFLFFVFFVRARGQSVQEAMLVYPRGGCGNTT
jgi:hypothetical protein